MGVQTRVGSEAELLDADAAAALLGVQPITVYRWCRAGRLRCRKPGKAWRIRRADVLALLQGSAPPETLAGHLGTFVTMPDQLLVIAEDPEVLRRVDGAFFQTGLAQQGRLVKLYDPATVSRHALASGLRRAGLAVDALEATGQLQWIAEQDPLAAVARLGEALAAEPATPTWAIFDWGGMTELATGLAQQAALAALVAAHPVVVATGVIEPDPAHWPPLAQQWQLLGTVRGVIRIGPSGMLLSRVLPTPTS